MLYVCPICRGKNVCHFEQKCLPHSVILKCSSNLCRNNVHHILFFCIGYSIKMLVAVIFRKRSLYMFCRISHFHCQWTNLGLHNKLKFFYDFITRFFKKLPWAKIINSFIFSCCHTDTISRCPLVMCYIYTTQEFITNSLIVNLPSPLLKRDKRRKMHAKYCFSACQSWQLFSVHSGDLRADKSFNLQLRLTLKVKETQSLCVGWAGCFVKW